MFCHSCCVELLFHPPPFNYSLLVISFLWQIYLYVLPIWHTCPLLLCFLQFRSGPFSGCPVSILDLFFLDFYIVTIFWVTLFLYGKHCFTLLLPLLLLLLWPFLCYFFSVKILMKFMELYFLLFFYWTVKELFGLNGGHVIVLLVLAIDDAWEMKKTADWNKVMIESWETFSWVSRKSLKLLSGLLFFSSFISFLLFHYLV